MAVRNPICIELIYLTACRGCEKPPASSADPVELSVYTNEHIKSKWVLQMQERKSDKSEDWGITKKERKEPSAHCIQPINANPELHACI